MADRNGVQRARFDTPKVVNFADPKGPEWMAKLGLTEDKVAAKAGRYTRGRNKGQVRGGVVILRCVEGGWYKGDAVFSGRVIYPGTTWLAVFWGEKDLGGLVYGTTANLIGQGYMLGRDGQATDAFNPQPVPAAAPEPGHGLSDVWVTAVVALEAAKLTVVKFGESWATGPQKDEALAFYQADMAELKAELAQATTCPRWARKAMEEIKSGSLDMTPSRDQE